MSYIAGKTDVSLFSIIIKAGNTNIWNIQYIETGAKNEGWYNNNQKLCLHFALSLMFVFYTKNRT